ncbi:hypothetical protein V2J09_009545 [Rumex salicifolius]
MAFDFLIIRAQSQFSQLKRKMAKRIEFALLVLIYCTVACLALSESCTAEGMGSHAVAVDDNCGSYKDHFGADNQDASVLSSDYLLSKSLIRSGVDDLCQNSKLFCFPSTLYGLISEERTSQSLLLDVNRDGVEVVLSGIGNGNSSWSEDFGLFDLSNGRTLSCSLHSGELIHDKQPGNAGNSDQEFNFSCDGPLLCENEGKFKSQNAEMKLPQPLDGSHPCVQISHYQLNWGESNLYHPSVTTLSIKNTCNEIALTVYEPFSTDSQFFPCNFSEVQLGPGEAVSLCLVFLPSNLGLSSAQLILQTSSGGFLVWAKGFGVESPYRIMPMSEFDVSSSGWKKSVSLFNPFDEAIELEEMIAWVSVVVGNSSLLAKAICREEGHKASPGPGFFNAKKCLDVRTGCGFPTMTLRPLSNWLIGPQGTGRIMDIAFQPNFDGKILGTICLQLRRTLLNKTEILFLPLEGELCRKPAYDMVTASIVASGIYEATREHVFSVSVANSGSELLKIVKITVVPENRKLLQIKYSEGLLLFPSSVTQVAVVMVRPLNVEYDNPCKICILTNSSVMPQLELPCQNFSHPYLRQSVEPYFDHQLHENVDIDEVTIGSLGQGKVASSATKILSKAEADEYVLQNWRNQGTGGDLTVIDEHRVVFPVVPVGGHLSKFITVKNPSSEPVVVQLIMNSGEIVDNCSVPDGNLHPYSSFYILHDDSDRPIGHGFLIGENAVKEAFVHPYGSVALGPIFFHPSNQCEWRSSVLVRNNISGVESLSLLGFGGSLSLLLHEGSELTRKIDFDLNLSVLLNISPPNKVLNPDDASSGCHKPVLKDLLVTNNGNLPISITGIYVSGSECQLDGFQVHNCKGFSLEPGESSKLQLSYQTDFTSSLVERDLELIMASSRLVIPMKATVPVFMLNSCRKSLFSFRVKKGNIAFFMAVSLMFGFMCFLLYHGVAPDSLDGSTDSKKNSIPFVSDSIMSSCMDHSQNGKAILEPRPDFSLRSNQMVVVGSDIIPDDQCREPKQRLAKKQGCENRQNMKPVVNSAELVQSPRQNVKPETSETINLTVKTGKDKVRRRRKRKGASTSSHSSASTPSSPLSPALPVTPKQLPARSVVKEEADPAPSHQAEKSPEIHSGPKRKTFGPEVSVKGSSSGPHKAEPTKGRLLQSATFPSTSTNSSSNIRCNSLARNSTSRIALYARAPGSKLRKQAEETEEKTGISDKFTYDIWGNHFERIHLGGRSNELRLAVPGFVENDFVSFFMEEPQTLVTNSECRSVSSSDQVG